MMHANTRKRFPFFKHTGSILVLLSLHLACFAQKITAQQAGEVLKKIETNGEWSFGQKTAALAHLKQRFDESRLVRDSVYARIYNRTAFYDAKLNSDIATNTTISSNLAAIEINRHAAKRGSAALAINCYVNGGIYYESIHLYRKALDYFDTTVLYARNKPGQTTPWFNARFHKIFIFIQSGDYQKAIEESTIGLAEAASIPDSVKVMQFFSQRAIAHFMQLRLANAWTDAETTILYANLLKDDFEKASALKVKALVHGKKQQFPEAGLLFRQAIAIRANIQWAGYQVADDYTDYGNFLLNEMHDYPKARKCYDSTIAYARAANDIERLAKAHLNIGVVYYEQRKYKKSLQFYTKALEDYKVLPVTDSLLENPGSDKLAFISNKEILLFIFNNKTEVLVALYKQTKQKQYLSAALQTALLTDTLITSIRHGQMEELSKLYWRSRTRAFFTNALEACFLDNNTALAFLFMEKSRAVLLNDKLKEIGAAAYLPITEAEIQQQLQIKVITAQQKLNGLQEDSARFGKQRLVFLAAKDTLEHYIRSLEQRFPAYFQYKYEDNLPALAQVQQYLSANKQSLVHYFVNDSTAYIICTTPRDCRMLKLAGKEFDYNQIARFTQMCSSREVQELGYDSFAALSHTLYKTLFQPLHITEKRVIICPDNFFLPFEALCTDEQGANYLVRDHAISYVYAARDLFRSFETAAAKGNFIGFAPASFYKNLGVVPLKNSVAALKQTAALYTNNRLLTNENATKERFLQDMFHYSVVNVFSHALADTGNHEPLLYMHDSVIHLSELQRPVRQSVRLVVLCACQTNVGKLAAGEGMYSLARGFASAGIPSVAATCWEAEELSAYAVTQQLHRLISQGLAIDIALQRVKTAFLQDGHHAQSLPYFWANMVIIGHTEPVTLVSEPDKTPWTMAMTAAAILLTAGGAWVSIRRLPHVL